VGKAKPISLRLVATIAFALLHVCVTENIKHGDDLVWQALRKLIVGY